MSRIADTPEPPYYAVIFSSLHGTDLRDYAETAARMEELAAQQPGYLGHESAREDLGITISYWKDLESIRRWKMQAEHREAQRLGREKWYAEYKLRIALVERDYGKPGGEAR